MPGTADGRGWQCVSKAIDGQGGAIFSGRVIGDGDLVLLHDAETYAHGTKITHGGRKLIVRRDLGGEVEFETPPSTKLLRGGDTLRLPAGRTTVHKADLLLGRFE